MSTKTTFKRVAAVAAAALTLGGFSAVSAHALSDTTAAITISGGDAGVAGVAGPANTIQVVIAKKSVSGDTNYYGGFVSVSGAGASITSVTHAGTTSSTNAVASTGLSVLLGENTNATETLTVTTPTVGSITVNLYNETALTSGLYSSTVSATKTITVNAAAASGIVTAANSGAVIASVDGTNATAYPVNYVTVNGAAATVQNSTSTNLAATDAAWVTADSTVVKSGLTANTGVAQIQVTVKDATGAKFNGDVLTAVVSGSGIVSSPATFSSSLPATWNTGARVATTTVGASTGTGHGYFLVRADGTAGTGTVTIYDGTVVIATKTVTFSGEVASFTLKANQSVASTAGGTFGYTGTASNAGLSDQTSYVEGAIVLKALDAAGNKVAGLDAAKFTITSSDTTVFSSTAVVTEDTSGYGSGYYIIQPTAVANSSGKAAALTVAYKFTNAAGVVTTVTASPVSLALGKGSIATLTATTDATSYNPGDKVTLTLTAKDGSGNPVADGVYNVFAAANGLAFSSTNTSVFTPSAQLTSAPFADNGGRILFVNGIATTTFYAPYGGSFSLTSTLSTDPKLAVALQGTTLAVTSTVTDAASTSAQAAIDAAQEATDAANAAYDAANNAMDSADAATAAAQDAADNASAALAAVTSLSATVAKLVKSVAAIAAALAKVQKKIGA